MRSARNTRPKLTPTESGCQQSMFETLSERVKSKATIKGSLHTYRFCDNVWTFILEDATVKLTNPSKQTDVLMLDKLKIVCCDGKLLSKEEG